eukprot:SAG22_NODE_721_length_7648_cov_9.418466_5_plen_196_part_00
MQIVAFLRGSTLDSCTHGRADRGRPRALPGQGARWGLRCAASFAGAEQRPMRILSQVATACACVLCALATGGAPVAASGYAPQHPRWAWDSVGHMAFLHTSNGSGLLSPPAAAVAAKFPLFTWDGSSSCRLGDRLHQPAWSPPACFAAMERTQLRQFAVLKKLNPNISTIYCEFPEAVVIWFEFCFLRAALRLHG